MENGYLPENDYRLVEQAARQIDVRVEHLGKQIHAQVFGEIGALRDELNRKTELFKKQQVRMECISLVCGGASAISTARSAKDTIAEADALAQYVLAGERPVSGTVNEIWDQAVMACWSIAHEQDEKCVGDEGTMAGIIADGIEKLFRGKKPGEA